MNSHEQYAALLDAFIDGALTEAEAGRVRAHLAECAECQAYVTEALTMRELFPGIEETVVPDGFAETVLSRLPSQNIPAQARDRRTQARNVRRRVQWTRFAVPLAACVTLALLVGGIWRGLPMNRAMSGGGAADTSASGNAVMTENATVTAGDVEESAPDMDEAKLKNASDMDEVTGNASEFDEVTAGSASEFDEVTAGSASDMDGGVAYSVKGAASDMDGGAMSESVADGGAIGNDTHDATAQNGSSASGASNATTQNGAARKRTYETPEAEESGLFDFGVTAPTIYDYATPSPETPLLGASYKAVDGGDTMPSQNIEPYAALQDAAAPRSTEEGVTQDAAAPVLEPVEPQRASGTSGASAESAPAESVAVSYWRLSSDAAPKLEQYAVVKKTASGAWYALDPEQFDALREVLPESALTPMDADSLADNPPPLRDRAPVYLFLPFP